ncbi:hypothetical protein VTK26DRAFT_8713 [Humicola hyalothermophila]
MDCTETVRNKVERGLSRGAQDVQDVHSSNPPISGLLRLPPHIRHRIYLYLGLASWNHHSYTFDLHGREIYPATPPGSFHGLLACCRAIYNEAAALLYSANQFVIHYSSSGSLEPLRALTPTALTSLTRLKIILNQASCHQPYDSDRRVVCCGDPSSRSRCEVHRRECLHMLPATSGLTSRAMLSEWHATAAYMSSYLRPNRLELALVCDVDQEYGLEAAKGAVSPLCLLPPLKDCHVRVCKEPDPRLREVAQSAVLQARRITTPYTTPPPRASQMTLLNLPREVRLLILQYTDLVTPWKEVIWSREPRGYMACHPPCVNEEYPGLCPKLSPERHSRCQFIRCWQTTNRLPPLGCFCARRHSAFSSTCRCWAPPGPALFLVCRALRRDAEFVFYSENRIVVQDLDPVGFRRVLSNQSRRRATPTTTPVGGYPNQRLAASQFLREVIPTRCLPFLRFLELAYPPYPPNFWPQESHLRDWEATVEWVRDKVNAQGLTIRVVMLDPYGGKQRDGDHLPLPLVLMTHRQGEAILEGYKGVLKPLKVLARDGLARFYGDLADPWAHSVQTWRYLESRLPNDWDAQERLLEARRLHLKQKSERCVMGERYDTLYANGKEEPPKSVWQHVFTWYF